VDDSGNGTSGALRNDRNDQAREATGRPSGSRAPREDIVLFLSVGVIDGVDPVDVDTLIDDMLEAYDSSR
jgi:hypothetical protein